MKKYSLIMLLVFCTITIFASDWKTKGVQTIYTAKGDYYNSLERINNELKKVDIIIELDAKRCPIITINPQKKIFEKFNDEVTKQISITDEFGSTKYFTLDDNNQVLTVENSLQFLNLLSGSEILDFNYILNKGVYIKFSISTDGLFTELNKIEEKIEPPKGVFYIDYSDETSIKIDRITSHLVSGSRIKDLKCYNVILDLDVQKENSIYPEYSMHLFSVSSLDFSDKLYFLVRKGLSTTQEEIPYIKFHLKNKEPMEFRCVDNTATIDIYSQLSILSNIDQNATPGQIYEVEIGGINTSILFPYSELKNLMTWLLISLP